MSDSETEKPLNFLEQAVADDLQSGKHGGRVQTRFPPEPNGYLHIGHAKAICINFGLAKKFGGKCNLRFDDTNPEAEDVEYVDAIREDVRWLGFEWSGEYYASDYFGKLYEHAEALVQMGKAYACELSVDEFKEYRGIPTQPGKEPPGRNRPVEENLDILRRMKAGEFEEGRYVLRAKIDMASPNLHLRDPAVYRIKKVKHHRTGDQWCIYPMYDFAHGLSDEIEAVTHSCCTLEFEVHRPLYEWFLDVLNTPNRPRQYEFARLNLTATVMSKRKLRRLVEEGHVNGWDDPRMPTVSGMRRRGYTAAAIRDFCERIGVAKRENIIDLALLEYCVREDLNKIARRAMAVLDPVKLVIENFPENDTDWLEAANHPNEEGMGTRKIPFTRELYIEREDFLEDPPKKFFRLAPGREVRLRWAYFVTCKEVIKNEKGEIVEIRCSYDPATRGGDAPDGRKVKATLHWVSAAHAKQVPVRLFDRLFTKDNPDEVEEGLDFISNLNPDSLREATAWVEPALLEAKPLDHYQFERVGYFCADKDSKPGAPVFNRTVTLKDSYKPV